MTQRVARPMKFAAFISIIISVAVMLAACQGAVGPKGDDGADGADGTSGRHGITPLQLKGSVPFVVISDVEDGDDDDDLADVGAAVTRNLQTYFRGGVGTPTLSDPASDLAANDTEDDEVFDATLEGTVLTITPKEDQPTAGYVVETFTVTISDDENNEIDLVIPARRNQPPQDAEGGEGTVGTAPPDMEPLTPPMCTATEGDNECYILVTFTDADAPDAATAVLTGEKLSFTAESDDTTKVKVVRVDEVDGEVLQARLIVNGLESTTDEDDEGTLVLMPVTVTVTATDEGGETATGEVAVTVDQAPTTDGTLPNRTFKQSEGPGQEAAASVVDFFEDPDSTTALMYKADTDDHKIATAVITDDGTMLTISPITLGGPVTVTVTATEGGDRGQSTSLTFEVTIVD